MTLIREYSILGADFDVISVDNAVVDVFSVLLLIFYVLDDVDINIDDEFVLMLMLLMCSNTITPKSAEVDEDLHNLGSTPNWEGSTTSLQNYKHQSERVSQSPTL